MIGDSAEEAKATCFLTFEEDPAVDRYAERRRAERKAEVERVRLASQQSDKRRDRIKLLADEIEQRGLMFPGGLSGRRQILSDEELKLIIDALLDE